MKRIGAGLLALAGLCVTAAAQAQMSLPGKFEVTDTGSASYTIPISIVPGTAGLEPKLSLQYDSRSGNGLLGLGWSLAGLPAITRCGRTITQDGAAGGVAFDANDRFCLDGQRLIATSGTYGADQTEYRTERESFSKVVSYGTVGSGPSWFKVWTKAGLVMEFGNTVDSKIEAQGKTAARVWALNKTSDTRGNFFSVSYTEDNANGEYRPDRIDYTGNGATSPANSVRFVYETRPDIVLIYQGGSLIKTTKRLTKVQAWQGATMAREYRALYGTTTASDLFPRMVSFTQCDGLNNCLPHTAFAHDANPSPLYPAASYSSPGGGLGASGYQQSFADIDGDGYLDALTFGLINQTWAVYVARGKGDGTFHPAVYSSPGGGLGASGYQQAFLDMNGDGMADAVTYGLINQTWVVYVALSKGDGTFHPAVYSSPGGGLGASGYQQGFADVNGDGLADSITYGLINQTWAVYVALSKGDGTFHPAVYSSPGGGLGASGYQQDFADVNGDGLADSITYGLINQTWAIYVARSKGDGTFHPATYYSPGGGLGASGYKLGMLDVNADGLADAVIYGLINQSWTVYVVLSKGDGTFGPVAASTPGNGLGASGYQQGFADVNGDGISDAVTYGLINQTWAVYAALGKGDGTFHPAVYSSPGGGLGASGYQLAFLDLNGDGRADAATYGLISQTWTVYGSVAPGLAPQPKEIVAASGSKTQLGYQRLVSSVHYTKDTGIAACAYPCVDVSGPLYVVSEVKSSNGLGGNYISTYRYAGAKADQHGRGFLGFRQMTVKDEQTGIEQVTSYRQDYPFTGLVASREKKLAAQLLNRSTNSYSSTNLGGTRRYPFLTQSLEESWELSGAALPAVTTAYQYDAWGNATQVGVSTGDGHAKTTTNTYSNDNSNWLLGRLTRSEVTSTTPGN
jgi:hypothetical protein